MVWIWRASLYIMFFTPPRSEGLVCVVRLLSCPAYECLFAAHIRVSTTLVWFSKRLLENGSKYPLRSPSEIKSVWFLKSHAIFHMANMKYRNITTANKWYKIIIINCRWKTLVHEGIHQNIFYFPQVRSQKDNFEKRQVRKSNCIVGQGNLLFF